MITGNSKINNLETLVDYLESEILELSFALADHYEGDELDPNFFKEIEIKQEAYQLLLKRITK